jgi:hypothetical protein
MNKEKIIAVRKDNLGRIIEYKTDKNNIYNYEIAKEYIGNGFISNACIELDKNNLWIIKEKDINSSISFEKMEEF